MRPRPVLGRWEPGEWEVPEEPGSGLYLRSLHNTELDPTFILWPQSPYVVENNGTAVPEASMANSERWDRATTWGDSQVSPSPAK